MTWLLQRWYAPSPFLPLLPLSYVFSALVALRRWAYRRAWRQVVTLPVPVVVVGNLTIGGTGKTPVVQALATHLKAQGLRPGIISRGYGRQAKQTLLLCESSTVAQAGDEALLLQRWAGVPVAVGRDRVQAARLLLAETGCDCIISDDGLQHYRLGRDVEVVLFDSHRGVGNGCLLPAGPMREPLKRAKSADFILHKQGNGADGFHYEATGVRKLKTGEVCALSEFEGRACHGVAGLARPQGFFQWLDDAGLFVEANAFPDHYDFTPEDFTAFGDELVLMTEKDAIKCEAFAGENWWAVTIQAVLPEAFLQEVVEKVRQVQDDKRHH